MLTVKAPAQTNIYADTQGQISILASTAAGQCVIVKFEVQSAGMAIPVPDTNFKAYLVENFDTNHDGEVSIAEAQSVTDISCNGMGITTLDGIEYFENLTVLGCRSNKLTSLDISRNLKLKTLDCGDNPIETLEIENHPSLENIWCNAAGFSTLKLSGLEKLTMIRAAGRYTSTSGTVEVTKRGEIASVQLADCPNLYYIDLNMNKVETLDIKNCDKISQLMLINNKLNGNIGFRNYSSLKYLYIDNNNIDKIVLENCPDLKSMRIESCPYLCFIIADEYLTSLNLDDIDYKNKYGETISNPGISSSNIWLQAVGLQEFTVNNNTRRPLYIASGNIQTVTANNCIPSRFSWFGGSSPENANLIIKDYPDAILDLRNESDIIGYKSIDCTQSPSIEKIYLPEGFDGDLRHNENVALIYGGDNESDL